jgi:hypothetical protein
MDNKQLRTAMVSTSISKYMPENILGEESAQRGYAERFEGLKRVFSWRQSLNLNLSIAARGATEGLWYVDITQAMTDAWSSMMIADASPNEFVMSSKSPNKILYFDADLTAAPWLQKMKFPETQLFFVNNQSLWNFEQFMRDDLNETEYDVDYYVVNRSEIGQGEATGFELISTQAYRFVYDNNELVGKCVDALAPGGVLLVNSSNNSGKLYRDDYWFHPNNEFHKKLKSLDGTLFHDSSNYGCTMFVKN